MKFINLTPHPVHYGTAECFVNLRSNGSTLVADLAIAEELLTWESAGTARIAIETVEQQSVLGIAMYATKYGEITGIPDGIGDDDLLIVSLMLQSAAKAANHPLANRMVSPYGVVRDAANTSSVLGCQGFTF